MRHPFSGRVFQFYIAVWALIIIAHIIFLTVSAGFSLKTAVADALIFNILSAVFGFSYWYMVKFLSPRQGITNIIISHAFGTAIGIALTVYLTTVLADVFSGDGNYLDFVNKSVVFRSVLALFYLVIIIMMYYLLQYNSQLQEQEKDEANLQKMLKQAELEMLKFQLNPHFIFNSLNSISSLTITDPPRAQQMVIKLSGFLRSSLGMNNTALHTLNAELEQMNLYLDIEKVRFGKRIQVFYDIEQKCGEMHLPGLLLQPVFENAIKHGLYNQLEDLRIEVKSSCSYKQLSLVIRNNYERGVGDSRGSGIGLTNINNRLQLIYGRGDLLRVNKENGIFEVQLLIPQE